MNAPPSARRLADSAHTNTGAARAPVSGGMLLVLLVGLFAVALGTRLTGLAHLVPQCIEMDPQIALQVRAYKEHGGWSTDTNTLNDYPTLVARIAALGSPPRFAGAPDEPAGLEEHLAAAASDVVRTRRVVAWFSAALAPLMFLVGRRFFGTAGGLLAALFVAFDPLHLLLSTQARPHGVVTTLALLAMFAAMEMRHMPSRRNYVLAGIAVGLALGTLHSGIALGLPLLFAHWTRERRAAPVPFVRIWWALVPLGVVFAYFYSDMLAALFAVGSEAVQEGTVRQGTHRVSFTMFDGGGIAKMAAIFFDSNPVLNALALVGGLGLLVGVARSRGRAWLAGDAGVALSFALPYFFVLCLYARLEERFTLPLLPYQALLATWVLLQGAALVRKRTTSGAGPILAMALLAVLALPVFTTLKLAWLRAQPDTFTQVARVLASEPDGGRTVLAPGRRGLPLDVPLFYAPASLGPHVERHWRMDPMWPRYQRLLPTEIPVEVPRYPFRVISLFTDDEVFRPGGIAKLLAAEEPEFFVLEMDGNVRTHDAGLELLDTVEQWGTLEWRFRPDEADDAAIRRLDYAWRPNFLWRVLTATCLGPELRIYRRRARSRRREGSQSLRSRRPSAQ